MEGLWQTRGHQDAKLSVQQLDLMLRQFDALATLPEVALRLWELLGQGEADRDDPSGAGISGVVSLVRLDPALTARLLSQANLRQDGAAQTAAGAAESIGPKGLREAMLSAELFDHSNSDGQADPVGLWRHCLGVASASRMLAESLSLSVEPEAAFACGLLHDLGKLALRRCFPKSYRRVLVADGRSAADRERAILGMDHCLVGRRLAQLWRLGEPIQQIIWLHHQAIESLPESIRHRELVAVVGLADALTHQCQEVDSCRSGLGRSPRQLAVQLGLAGEVLDDIAGRIDQAVGEHVKSLGLDRSVDDRECQVTLAQAGIRMAQANGRLRSQAGRTHDQAQAFGQFCDFLEGLRPEASTGDVLGRIASVLAGTVDAEAGPVVCYSAVGSDEHVLAVRSDGPDSLEYRTFDRTSDFEPTGVVPTSAATAIANMLAEPADMNAWLAAGDYTHRPLTAGGRWIGGVIVPQRRAEGADEMVERVEEVGKAREALLGAFALALATVQQRSSAMELSEQLLGASEALKDAQEQLAEAKTFAAIGEMAAGAAHELNNPLAVLSGRAQLMGQKAQDPAEQEVWRTIADQAGRISDIITELMDVADPPPPVLTAVDVPGVLSEAALEFSSSDHPQAGTIVVDIEAEEQLPAALADPSHLRAVIAELIRNAATAGGDGAEVTVSASGESAGRAILIVVSDKGPGMDAETAERVFAPFFSAQPAGRRRGLGLTRARRYVESNGGRIWLESGLGAGTSVFVRLQAVRAPDRS